MSGSEDRLEDPLPGLPARGTSLAGEASRRLKDLTALQEIYSVLSAEPDLDRTLRHAVGKISEVLGADVCAFLLHDPDSGELVVQPGALGLPEDAGPLLYRVRVDGPLTSSGRVFLTKTPFLSDDAQRDERVEPRYPVLWNYRSLIVVPLALPGGSCIGVLRVGHRRAGAFDREHLRLAALVAEHAAAVIENARLYRRAQANVRELKRLNDLKTEFLSMVSHDLLSPLSSVQGFVSLLLGEEAGSLTERQREFLSLCDGSLRRVTVLIDDLLDLSRIEAGSVRILPEAVDLGQLLSLACREHEPAARERGLTLSAHLPGRLPPLIADPHRLRQVVDNLVRNALKFTPEGGKVLVSARDAGEEVVVSVKDTGIGLSEADRERVFERYYQVEEVSSRRGAGLGLAICKSLVERHGGRIWVDSAPGRGAEFQFTLPLRPSVS